MLGYEWFDWPGFFSRGTALAKWHRVGEIVQRFCRWKVGEGPGAGSGGCPPRPGVRAGRMRGLQAEPCPFSFGVVSRCGWVLGFVPLALLPRAAPCLLLLAGRPTGGLPKPRPLVAAVGWDLPGAGSLLFRL